MFKKLFYAVFREPRSVYWREGPIARQFMAKILPGDVLDVGAASGKMAEYIQKHSRHQVAILDVVDHNETDLPLVMYDGGRIPFDNAQFTTSLVVFVLHHADDPMHLLREVARVTSRRIILVEDTPVGRLERRLWRFWDNLLNNSNHADINVAHEALSIDQWQQFCTKAGLRIVEHKTFRSALPVLWSYRHTYFVLEKI